MDYMFLVGLCLIKQGIIIQIMERDNECRPKEGRREKQETGSASKSMDTVTD
jgi:hypothetical protein